MQLIRNHTRVSRLREVLKSLPSSLNKIYDRILHQIEIKGNLEDTIRILQVLCFSFRPMDATEMVKILAVHLGSNPRFVEEDRLIDTSHLTTICSSLISIQLIRRETPGNNHARGRDIKEVRLAHASVLEYLLSNTSAFAARFVSDQVYQLLAEASLVYLLHIADGGITGWDACTQYPYYTHAADYWWRHARQVNRRMSPTFIDLVARLFDDRRRLYTWLQLGDLQSYGAYDGNLHVEDMGSSLYYAVLIGLSQVVEMLLGKKENINEQRRVCSTALYAAVSTNSLEMVQLLLNHGADVNITNRLGDNSKSLEEAAVLGNIDIVWLLLDQKADIDAIGGNGESALQVAASCGHMEIVRLLLERGAKVNLQGGHFFSENALNSACRGGHDAVAQLLLDHGADVNARVGEHGTALLTALARLRFDVVQMLIENGADISTKMFDNPLEIACRWGKWDLARYMLRAGADVNDCGENHTSPLSSVARNGSADLVRMLLDHGAQVNAVPKKGDKSPLQWATFDQRESVVLLLLQHGADINYCCDYDGTALDIALDRAEESLSLLLIDNGACAVPDVMSLQRCFVRAALRGYLRVLDILFEKVVSFNGDVQPLLSPALIFAARYGRDSFLKQLVDRGADVNEDNGNALETAILFKQKSAVEMLLDKGALVNISLDSGQTPLELARDEQCWDIAQLLEQRGGEVSSSASLQHGEASLRPTHEQRSESV